MVRAALSVPPFTGNVGFSSVRKMYRFPFAGGCEAAGGSPDFSGNLSLFGAKFWSHLAETYEGY